MISDNFGWFRMIPNNFKGKKKTWKKKKEDKGSSSSSASSEKKMWLKRKKTQKKKRRIKAPPHPHPPDHLRNYEAGHTYDGLKTKKVLLIAHLTDESSIKLLLVGRRHDEPGIFLALLHGVAWSTPWSKGGRLKKCRAHSMALLEPRFRVPDPQSVVTRRIFLSRLDSTKRKW